MFDGFSSSRAGRCLGSGSGSGGRTRCLFPFPLTLTFAHALPLTDLQWAMPVQVVSCTQSIQPRVSTLYTLDPRPPPTQPLHPHHVLRQPNSHSRTPGSRSPSSPCPPSLSNTTSSSSETPGHVSLNPQRFPHISIINPLILFFPSQHQHAPTLLSRSSAMGHSELCGCAIGMGPYPPIHLCPLCSAVRVHVPSTPTSVS